MLSLSTEQIDHFVREGFVVVPGAVAAEPLQQARELFWSAVAPGRAIPWRRWRCDPGSWLREPRVASQPEHACEDWQDGGYLSVFGDEELDAGYPEVSATGLRFFCAGRIGSHPALLGLL